MKKIYLGVVFVVAIAIVGVFATASTHPDTVHVERSLTMAGTSADLTPYLTDMKKYMLWIPWAGVDPIAKNDFSDPSEGVGA